jgi:hypothetical protein
MVTRNLRSLVPALIVALAAPLGVAGCGEESKTESKTTQTSPTGTTTETRTDKVNESGSNPPAPTGSTETSPPK